MHESCGLIYLQFPHWILSSVWCLLLIDEHQKSQAANWSKLLHWLDVTNMVLASRRKVCASWATLVWWLKKGWGFRSVRLLALSWADCRLLQRPASFKRSPLCSQAEGDLVMSNGLLRHFSLCLPLSLWGFIWRYSAVIVTQPDENGCTSCCEQKAMPWKI